MRIEQENWKSAAIIASNLSELELIRGHVVDASRTAEQSVILADRSTDAIQRAINRTTHADALRHQGLRKAAKQRFEEAESIQAEQQSQFPELYARQGFDYCDLLLSTAERAAWLLTLTSGDELHASSSTPRQTGLYARALSACGHVHGRATRTLEWVMKGNLGLLAIALDHLTLGRVSLYCALLATFGPDPTAAPGPSSASFANLATAQQHLDAAVDSLRCYGSLTHLPRGLLTRAWLHHLLGHPTAATTDLDEAEAIASRGPMPIFLADIHLTRARLSRDRAELAKARELLADLRARGYHRHDKMLTDADVAAESWPAAPPK